MSGSGADLYLGIFGNAAPILADVSLIIQIALLILVVSGWLVARRRRYANHGRLMAVAFGAHIATVMVVMIPSLVASRGIFLYGVNSLALVAGAHAILGSLALILGFIMMGRWLLNRLNIKACLKRKGQMRLSLIVWLAALGFGVYSYFIFYPVR